MICEDCRYYSADYCEYGHPLIDDCYDYEYEDSADAVETARKKKIRRLRMAGRQGQKSYSSGGVKFILMRFEGDGETMIRLGDVESVKSERQEDGEWLVSVKVMGEEEEYKISGFEEPINIKEWVKDRLITI
jgi:hypothetical protein